MTSVDNQLELLIRRIINDRQIFDYGRDNRFRLIDRARMGQFRKWLDAGDVASATRFLRNRVEELNRSLNSARDKRDRNDWQQAKEFAESLLIPDLEFYWAHLRRVCSILEDFGSLKCLLPAMEQYGQVIEREPRPVVDEFLAYKVDKAQRRERSALQRLREHIAWGYDVGISNVHLAFIVRKANSLPCLTEVGHEHR